jgi:siroheme synthase (precorrin-2 oxidase/ferrochelatase)
MGLGAEDPLENELGAEERLNLGRNPLLQGGVVRSPLMEAQAPPPPQDEDLQQEGIHWQPEVRRGRALQSLRDLLLGVPEGALQTYRGAGQMLGALVGAPPRIEDVEPTSIYGQYGRGLGSALAPLAVIAGGALFGVSAPVSAGIGLGVMGLAEAWDAYQRELQRQKEEEGGFNKDKALAKAALYGTGSTALELFIGKGLHVAGVSPSDALYRFSRRFSGSAATARMATELSASVVENLAEEASQRALQDIIVEGKLTPGVVEEGVMGGLIGPPAVLLGKHGIRGALRLRAAITGRQPETTVEQLLRSAGVEAAHASSAAELFSQAADVVADAEKILPAITRREDLQPYLTDANRTAIAQGRAPDPFANPQRPDGAALLWNAYNALIDAGVLAPQARLTDEGRTILERFSRSLAQLQAADRLAGRHGSDVAKQVLETIERIYEGKDIETGKVPSVAGESVDQRAEGKAKEGVAQRRGAHREATERPTGRRGAEAPRAQSKEVFAAIGPEDLRKRVSALLEKARKQVQQAKPQQQTAATAPQPEQQPATVAPAQPAPQPATQAVPAAQPVQEMPPPQPAAVQPVAEAAETKLEAAQQEAAAPRQEQPEAPRPAEQPTAQPRPQEATAEAVAPPLQQEAQPKLQDKFREHLDKIWWPLQSDLADYAEASKTQPAKAAATMRQTLAQEIRNHIEQILNQYGPGAARQFLLLIGRAQKKPGVTIIPKSSKLWEKFLDKKEYKAFVQRGVLPEPVYEHVAFTKQERRQMVRLGQQPPPSQPAPAKQPATPAATPKEPQREEARVEEPVAPTPQVTEAAEQQPQLEAEAASTEAQRREEEVPPPQAVQPPAQQPAPPQPQLPARVETPAAVAELPDYNIQARDADSHETFERYIAFGKNVSVVISSTHIPFIAESEKKHWSKEDEKALRLLSQLLPFQEDTSDPLNAWPDLPVGQPESDAQFVVLGSRLERLIKSQAWLYSQALLDLEGLRAIPDQDLLVDKSTWTAYFDRSLVKAIRDAIYKADPKSQLDAPPLPEIQAHLLEFKTLIWDSLASATLSDVKCIGHIANNSLSRTQVVFSTGTTLFPIHIFHLRAVLNLYPDATLKAGTIRVWKPEIANYLEYDALVIHSRQGELLAVLGAHPSRELRLLAPGIKFPYDTWLRVPPSIQLVRVYDIQSGKYYRLPNWHNVPIEEHARLQTWVKYPDAALAVVTSPDFGRLERKLKDEAERHAIEALKRGVVVVYDNRHVVVKRRSQPPIISRLVSKVAISLNNLKRALHEKNVLGDTKLVVNPNSNLATLLSPQFLRARTDEKTRILRGVFAYAHYIGVAAHEILNAIPTPSYLSTATDQYKNLQPFTYAAALFEEAAVTQVFVVLDKNVASAIVKEIEVRRKNDPKFKEIKEQRITKGIPNYKNLLDSYFRITDTRLIARPIGIAVDESEGKGVWQKRVPICVVLTDGQHTVAIPAGLYKVLNDISVPYNLHVTDFGRGSRYLLITNKRSGKPIGVIAGKSVGNRIAPVVNAEIVKDRLPDGNVIYRPSYIRVYDDELVLAAQNGDTFALIEAFNRGIINDSMLYTVGSLVRDFKLFIPSPAGEKIRRQTVDPRAFSGKTQELQSQLAAEAALPKEERPAEAAPPQTAQERTEEPEVTQPQPAAEPAPAVVSSEAAQVAEKPAEEAQPATAAPPKVPPAQPILQQRGSYLDAIENIAIPLSLPYYNKDIRNIEFDRNGNLTRQGLRAFLNLIGSESRQFAIGLIDRSGKVNKDLANDVAKHMILVASLRGHIRLSTAAPEVGSTDDPIMRLWDIVQSGKYANVLTEFLSRFKPLINILADGKWTDDQRWPFHYIAGAILLRNDYDLSQSLPDEMRPSQDLFGVWEPMEGLGKWTKTLARLRASYITRELAKNIDLLPQFLDLLLDAATGAYNSIHIEDKLPTDLRGIERAFYSEGILPILDEVIRSSGRTPLPRGQLIYAAPEVAVPSPAPGGALPAGEDLFEPKDVDEFITLVEQLPDGFELAIALRMAKQMGLFKILPGLQFSISKMPNGRVLAYYDPARNLVVYTVRALNQPWRLTAHELLHAIFEALPDEEKALVHRLRMRAIERWLASGARTERGPWNRLLVLTALGIGSEPLLNGRLNVPREIYHLTSDTEFFVWMLEHRLESALLDLARSQTERSLLQRLWDRVLSAIRRVVDWAKGLMARLRPDWDDELKRNINRFWDRLLEAIENPGVAATPERAMAVPSGEPVIHFALDPDGWAAPYVAATSTEMSANVEAARRFATAYIRSALENMAGSLDKLRKQDELAVAEQREMERQKNTNQDFGAVLAAIDAVIDLERFAAETGLDPYEPKGFARLVQAVQDRQNAVSGDAYRQAIEALRRFRHAFYTWSAYLYAKDLADNIVMRDAAVRQLTYLRVLRDNEELMEPGATELIAGDMPAYDIALPGIKERIAELEEEVAKWEKEVQDSEKELENFISRHAAGLTQPIISGEVWPLESLYRALVDGQRIKEIPQNDWWTPDTFRTVFTERVNQLVELAITSDSNRYQQMVLYKTATDQHLKAFARGDYRIAEIGFSDLVSITERALAALYENRGDYSEEERRAIAASFVHAVLKFNYARDRAFNEYMTKINILANKVDWIAYDLLAKERLQVVAQKLAEALKAAKWPETKPYSNAEIAYGIVRMATMLAKWMKDAIKESAPSQAISLIKGLVDAAQAIATRAKAAPTMQAKAALYREAAASALNAFLTEQKAAKKSAVAPEKVSRLIGLSDAMLAVIMELMATNPTISRATIGLVATMVRSDERISSLVKAIAKRLEDINRYLRQRRMIRKRKAQAAGKKAGTAGAQAKPAPQADEQQPIKELDRNEIRLLKQHIETILTWIDYDLDPQIAELKRQLIEAKSDLDALLNAVAIWNGVTNRSFPRADGTGDTPFWEVWNDAMRVSGLSRVMVTVGPEDDRTGSGTIVFQSFPGANQVIISPWNMYPHDTILVELSHWSRAAVTYIATTRALERKYREFIEATRGKTEQEIAQMIKTGQIEEAQTPESLGYDPLIANGLENALITHAAYFAGEVPFDIESPEHESSLLRFISSTKFTHTLEQLISWIPQPFRTPVKIWLARWANQRLELGKIYTEYLPRINQARLKAMQAFGTMSEPEYRTLVWAPLTEYARQHGVRVEPGIKLRTGHVITKEDLELLRLVHSFERDLLRLSQKIHGHDPNLGVVDAVVGTMFSVGGVTYARYAGSVGTYGLPRRLNDAGYALLERLATAYSRIRDDEKLNTEYRSLMKGGWKALAATGARFEGGLQPIPVFQMLIEPWLAAEYTGIAEAYLTDALRHRSDVAMERSDWWLRVLRKAAELYLADATLQNKRLQPNSMLPPIPAQWRQIIPYVEQALEQIGDLPEEVQDDEDALYYYAAFKVFEDLDRMARFAVSATNAERFQNMATRAAQAAGRSFLNEFTKPAGTLVLPSAVYTYGVLTDGEMQMATLRAQAYTFVEFALAIKRARAHVEEMERVGSAGQLDTASLKRIRQLVPLIRALEESVISLATLAWTGRSARDPIFLSMVKSVLLSNIVVTLRNLTLGPILAWIHNAQLLNVSRALATWVTIKQAAAATYHFVRDLSVSSARSARVLMGLPASVFRALWRRKGVREAVESFLENLSDAVVTDLVRNVSATGFSLSRRTAHLAYLTWIMRKVHKTLADEAMWRSPGISGLAHRVGRGLRAGASAATQILRSIGTEIADVYLNSMAADSAAAIERHLEEIAEKVYNRLTNNRDVDEVQTLARGLLPIIPARGSRFRITDEDISDRGLPADRAEHAAELRDLMEEAGINLDTLILGTVKRMAIEEARRFKESGGRIMPGSQKLELSVLDEQQRIDLMRALMRRFNQGDIVNRPIVAILDTTKRTILTFMGYSINFLHQLIAFIAGKPATRLPDKLLLALWKILWLAMVVLFFGQVSIKTTNEVKQFVFGDPPTVPTVFDLDFWKNWTLAKRSLFFSVLLGLPLVGDLLARAAGVVFGNRGWTLTDRVLAVRLVDDFFSTIFNTGKNLVSLVTSERPFENRIRDVFEPSYQALTRYVWFATPFVRAVSETRDAAIELRQARSMARYYATLSGVATEQKAKTAVRISEQPDVVRQRILTDIAAAAARRDPQALKAAIDELVIYFRERGSVDPERSAQTALQGINPFHQVADGRTPDDAEISRILATATPEAKTAIAKAYDNYLWAKNVASSLLGTRRDVGLGGRGGGAIIPGRAVSIRGVLPGAVTRRLKIPRPRSTVAAAEEAAEPLTVLRRPEPPLRIPGRRGLITGRRLAGRVPSILRVPLVGRPLRVRIGPSAGAARAGMAEHRPIPRLGRIVERRLVAGRKEPARALRMPIGKA